MSWDTYVLRAQIQKLEEREVTHSTEIKLLKRRVEIFEARLVILERANSGSNS